MISYREQVLQSWVQDAPSVRGLASLLGVPPLVTVRGTLDRLRVVETVTVDSAINTDDDAPINGHVTITLRSDGTYVFSGFMRATGLPSYHFAVQAWVDVAEGTVLAAQESGRIFGSDTPGHRQRDWSEPGSNRGVVLHWRSLRQGRSIGYKMHADIAGLLGGARDVLVFVVEGIALVYSFGATGWVVLIGSELASLDAQLASPDILEGIAVGSVTLLVLGPYGLVPALIAGALTVALSDVRHRSMGADERAFADRVFNGRVDFDRVVLTNLSHDDGRKFTIPSIGNAILVNLDDAFDAPLRYGGPPGSEYAQPAAVFIHELTHAWQITNNSFLGVICGMDSNYDYFDSRGRMGDTAWPKRRWSTFNNEQQAHIVDDWYGAHVVVDAMGNYLFDAKGIPLTDLDGFASTNDPAFHFIRDNIRVGVV
jgi:hypothetical protein